MFDFVRSHQRVASHLAARYVYQIAEALEFIRLKKVIYRDLKLENVLVSNAKDSVLLADFGLSKQMKDASRTSTICGTIQYMAPEILQNVEYSYEVDWWSLGIMAYLMVVGKYPFSKGLGSLKFDRSAEDRKIMWDRVSARMLNYPDDLPKDMRSCLDKLLQADPAKRLCTSAALAAEPWIAGANIAMPPPTPIASPPHKATGSAAKPFLEVGSSANTSSGKKPSNPPRSGRRKTLPNLFPMQENMEPVSRQQSRSGSFFRPGRKGKARADHDGSSPENALSPGFKKRWFRSFHRKPKAEGAADTSPGASSTAKKGRRWGLSGRRKPKEGASAEAGCANSPALATPPGHGKSRRVLWPDDAPHAGSPPATPQHAAVGRPKKSWLNRLSPWRRKERPAQPRSNSPHARPAAQNASAAGHPGSASSLRPGNHAQTRPDSDFENMGRADAAELDRLAALLEAQGAQQGMQDQRCALPPPTLVCPSICVQDDTDPDSAAGVNDAAGGSIGDVGPPVPIDEPSKPSKPSPTTAGSAAHDGSNAAPLAASMAALETTSDDELPELDMGPEKSPSDMSAAVLDEPTIPMETHRVPKPAQGGWVDAAEAPTFVPASEALTPRGLTWSDHSRGRQDQPDTDPGRSYQRSLEQAHEGPSVEIATRERTDSLDLDLMTSFDAGLESATLEEPYSKRARGGAHSRQRYAYTGDADIIHSPPRRRSPSPSTTRLHSALPSPRAASLLQATSGGRRPVLVLTPHSPKPPNFTHHSSA